MKKRKYDIAFIAAIALIAALLWLVLFLTRTEGAFVRVTVDGELYGEYVLNTDVEMRIGDAINYNILKIENGEASFVEASCPDKLCVHQGNIHYDGQSIVCLPNKVVAEIISGEQSEIDAVAK